MIASWGLLAFLKAADTRQNASFAIRLDKKGEFEQELEGGGMEEPEEIFRAVPDAPRMRKAPSRRRADDRRFDDTTIVTKSRPPEKKPSKYKDFSDDDFFDSFESRSPANRSAGNGAAGRTYDNRTASPASRNSIDDDPLLRTLKNGPTDEDDKPITLDDIFGGDDK